MKYQLLLVMILSCSIYGEYRIILGDDSIVTNVTKEKFEKNIIEKYKYETTQYYKNRYSDNTFMNGVGLLRWDDNQLIISKYFIVYEYTNNFVLSYYPMKIAGCLSPDSPGYQKDGIGEYNILLNPIKVPIEKSLIYTQMHFPYINSNYISTLIFNDGKLNSISLKYLFYSTNMKITLSATMNHFILLTNTHDIQSFNISEITIPKVMIQGQIVQTFKIYTKESIVAMEVWHANDGKQKYLPYYCTEIEYRKR